MSLSKPASQKRRASPAPTTRSTRSKPEKGAPKHIQGAEIARAFSAENQDIDVFDGAGVLRDSLIQSISDISDQLIIWKVQLTPDEYTKALETLLHEHVFDYIIKRNVCDNFLAWGPTFN